jgi:UDP-glucuronate decarboxylase
MSSFFLDSDIEEIVKRLGDRTLSLAGKTVLLTGGRGFLGRYFSQIFWFLNENILDEPLRVIILDNLISSGRLGDTMIEMPNSEFIQHDVTQTFEFDDKIDFIVHAAGIASPFYYRAYPLETLDVAIQGTRNMLELAREKHARFMFFSSSEIYGNPDEKHVPTQESYRGYVASQGPRACYDESKRVGETLCYVFHDKFGTQTNIIRPFNIFGPGMQETDYRVLPNFASRIKAGKELSVYGPGEQTRTFCYITDAMFGFFLVLLNGIPGETYNIGNPVPEISMIDLTKMIGQVLEKKVEFNIIEHPDSYPADEPQRRCPDIRKAQIQLDYTPEIELREGLSRFFSWAELNYQN